MPKEVVFTHRKEDVLPGREFELVYCGDASFAAIERVGRTFVVRGYSKTGTLGPPLAVRHTFELAFHTATAYGIREGLGGL